MSVIFNPTAEETRALEALIAAIPQIQDKLVVNHRQLTRPDRGAHQQQIAGGKVLLTLERSLPPALAGLGVFQHDGSAGPHFIGIGRMSTGLGCPHAETDPDFLGLMVAFQAKSGRRIDLHHDQRSHFADRHARGVRRPPPRDRGCRGDSRSARQPGETAAQPGAARRDQGGLDCHARDGSDAPDASVPAAPTSSTGPGSSARATRSASSPSYRPTRRSRAPMDGNRRSSPTTGEPVTPRGR